MPSSADRSTNVEAIIADPANDVTPNQAQTDLLNEELATYWRITDAWVQSQAGAAPDDRGDYNRSSRVVGARRGRGDIDPAGAGDHRLTR